MYKNALLYASFAIACILIILTFLTATTYLQLSVAILLYPILVFFAYKILPGRNNPPSSGGEPPVSQTFPPNTPTAEVVTEQKTSGISDADKRAFLQLLGGTGLFLFAFSFLNKKIGSPFFKGIPANTQLSLHDTSGNKIDPAQNQPLDGYAIAEIDNDTVSFYGFTHRNGSWYVMKVDTNTGSFRYSKGQGNFPENWDSRANLKYDYFSNVFN